MVVTEVPGSSPDHPMLDIPPDWRHVVAGWPHDRWVAWRRRSGEILAAANVAEAPGPDADEIREADRRAFDEMTRPSLFVVKAT
jgi:hypothetical protein